jgi:hypothetical protein
VSDEKCKCVRCGIDLTDPKVRGDRDESGDWVCSKVFCRSNHPKPLQGVPEYVTQVGELAGGRDGN